MSDIPSELWEPVSDEELTKLAMQFCEHGLHQSAACGLCGREERQTKRHPDRPVDSGASKRATARRAARAAAAALPRGKSIVHVGFNRDQRRHDPRVQHKIDQLERDRKNHE